MNAKRHPTKFPLLPFGLILLVPSLALGAGVAAIKEQTFHQDAGANVVVYSSLKKDDLSVTITAGIQTITVAPQKLAGNVEVLPALPAEITTDAYLDPVRKAAKEYRDFTTRFPKSTSILTPHIAALDNFIKEFENGKARYKGQWIATGEAFAAKQKNEESTKAGLAESTQLLRGKMEFNEAQKAKGLAKYDGKWLPSDEVIRLAEKDQLTLEKEVDAVNQVKQKAAKEEAILAAAQDAVLRVIGSNDNGVLCKIAFFRKGTDWELSKDDFGRSKEIKTPVVRLTTFSDDTVYVQGVSGVVDGALIRVRVLAISEPYAYQTTLGSRATVRRLQAVGEIKSFGRSPSVPLDSYVSPPATSLQSVGGG